VVRVRVGSHEDTSSTGRAPWPGNFSENSGSLSPRPRRDAGRRIPQARNAASSRKNAFRPPPRSPRTRALPPHPRERNAACVEGKPLAIRLYWATTSPSRREALRTEESFFTELVASEVLRRGVEGGEEQGEEKKRQVDTRSAESRGRTAHPPHAGSAARKRAQRDHRDTRSGTCNGGTARSRRQDRQGREGPAADGPVSRSGPQSRARPKRTPAGTAAPRR